MKKVREAGFGGRWMCFFPNSHKNPLHFAGERVLEIPAILKNGAWNNLLDVVP
ncbi:MAG: hypothetical protein JWM99_4651 [Verrucomicrobiales bacterium]|nr:hypothetical protein [Verrucomicrobiales bacterium]